MIMNKNHRSFGLQLASRKEAPRGFTLVEMLVATAVTLLMMIALARAFGFVGKKVQDGRGETTLSNQLRDITTRLSDELEQSTVTLNPTSEGEDPLGYFLYYEGPVTNATSALFRAINDGDGNLDLNDTKHGDFDDYLAFTAVAKGNNWFVGKVPRYILDIKALEQNNIAASNYTVTANSFDPVVIRSKYAEIIYFASPEYELASLPSNPAYIDVDGDLDLGSGNATQNGIPDRLRLHRRVLLIRPDLNVVNLNALNPSWPGSPGMVPLDQSGVDHFGDSLTVKFMAADAWPSANGSTINTGANQGPDADASLGWLYGMAGVHQQCDLSMRRILDSSGNPTSFVAANSLADLSKPHNRFAHVRVPNSVMGGGSGSLPTSMPLLALGNAASILSTNTVDGTRIAPPATPSVGPVVTPTTLSGFLRPEFVLGGDLTHLDSIDAWGQERIGEDLLTNNTLAFDIQIYDPSAAVFTTSDGVVVRPSDAGYRQALRQATAGGQSNTEFGSFVDLAYPVLAGGSLRGWQPRRLERRSTNDEPIVGTEQSFLVTPFSGIDRYTPADTSVTAYIPSLYQSGRLATSGITIQVFQPAFDTYTMFYERDGFAQLAPSGGFGTRWSPLSSSSTLATQDRGSDGLDNDGVFGIDDAGEMETRAPFPFRPEAVRISIRLENPSLRLIRQSSVEHRDQL